MIALIVDLSDGRRRNAASLAHRIYPMIDGRNITPASYAVTDPRVWRQSNRLGWKAYLGRDGGGDDISPYEGKSWDIRKFKKEERHGKCSAVDDGHRSGANRAL